MEKKQVKTKENRKHETLYKEAKTRNNIYIYTEKWIEREKLKRIRKRDIRKQSK
jgi:hypothetical protein